MDNKKQGISNIGAVKKADKDTLSNSEKSGDAGKAHNLSLLNKKKKYILFVPESGPMDNQLYKS